MITFTETEELWKGLTDLPIALLAFVFYGLFFRYKNERGAAWRLVFLLLGIAGTLGASVHIFVMNRIVWDILWIILYVFLYETVRRFLALMAGIVTLGRHLNAGETRFILILEAVLFLGSAVLVVLDGMADIYLFVFFSLLAIAPVVWGSFTGAGTNRTVKTLVILLTLAAVSQIVKELIPYGVVIGHTLILASLTFVYLAARRSALSSGQAE